MTQHHTPQSRCRFGLARCDITPTVGMYHRMWGAAAHDRSTGVHRPLCASVMVFRPLDEDRQQVLVALDHCLFFQPEIRSMKEAICSDLEVQPDELQLLFSHTHGAGLMDPAREDMPGGDLIKPYLDSIAAKIHDATHQALASIQPVTISYGTGRCSLAAHRDFWDEKNELFACGFNPREEADDTVMVARVNNADDGLVATIVNYACHPTTLAWDNTLVSPDYVGALVELVERETGATCIFVQGASGDLGPRDGFVGDVAVADRNGRQLAHAALSSLEGLPAPNTVYEYQGPVISGATIGEWKHRPLDDDRSGELAMWQLQRTTVQLPYLDDLPSRKDIADQFDHWQREEQSASEAGDEQKAADARAMVERMRRWKTRTSALPDSEKFPYPLTIWRMGDAIWVAVDGEPYNLLQRRLRERFPGVPIMVMVLADGSKAWYLPTAETYGKGIYQESMAILKQGSLETMIDAAGNVIEELISSGTRT